MLTPHLALSIGEYPAPGDAHAVVLHSHGAHQSHVLLVPEQGVHRCTVCLCQIHTMYVQAVPAIGMV